MRTVVITVTAGTPRREWCDICLTSAHVTVDMHVLGEDGPTCVGSAGGCERCRTGMFAAETP